MLLNSFFMTDPYNPIPYWNGHVFFESSTPGTYSVVIPKGIKCGYICVGAGAGGFCAKTGITINEGTPSEATFTGLTASSGASGRYQYRDKVLGQDYFSQDVTLVVEVGQGKTGYASSNVYGIVSASHPRILLSQSHPFGSSGVYYDDGHYNYTICGAFGGGDAWIYLSDPNNPNSRVYEPSDGGNNGLIVGQGTNVSLAGGASVYNGYGAGGSAGWTGDNQYGTPWADAGGNGYVKIFAILPD